jgi:hypothetical protein
LGDAKHTTRRKALYIARCSSLDDHHYIRLTIAIMPRHTLAKFGIGHTAFDDANSKAIILATLHTILTSMTLWRSRGTIAPGEVVMSVTSVIAMWGNVSLIRQLRASELRPLKQSTFVKRSD